MSSDLDGQSMIEKFQRLEISEKRNLIVDMKNLHKRLKDVPSFVFVSDKKDVINGKKNGKQKDLTTAIICCKDSYRSITNRANALSSYGQKEDYDFSDNFSIYGRLLVEDAIKFGLCGVGLALLEQLGDERLVFEPIGAEETKKYLFGFVETYGKRMAIEHNCEYILEEKIGTVLAQISSGCYGKEIAESVSEEEILRHFYLDEISYLDSVEYRGVELSGKGKKTKDERKL